MSCERNRYRKLQVYTSIYKYRIFLYHSLLESLIIVCIYLLRKREIYKNDNFYYTVVLILKTNKRQSSKVNSSRKYRRRNATHFLLLRNFFSDLWTLLNNPIQSILNEHHANPISLLPIILLRYSSNVEEYALVFRSLRE